MNALIVEKDGKSGSYFEVCGSMTQTWARDLCWLCKGKWLVPFRGKGVRTSKFSNHENAIAAAKAAGAETATYHVRNPAFVMWEKHVINLK